MLASIRPPSLVRAAKLALGACALLSLAACNKTDDMGLAMLGGTNGARLASPGSSPALMQQTMEWGAKYAKNPHDPAIGINYARHLRAVGANDKALEVLTQTAQANPGNAAVSADLGRSALEANDLVLAERELTKAEQAGQTDWRTLSALGTLNAKRDSQGRAREYYEAALKKNPGAASVKNNLALSYALDGKPDKAESLMREAASDGDLRVRQNLSLILGVQGKKAEAQSVATADSAVSDSGQSGGLLKALAPAKRDRAMAAAASTLPAWSADEDPDPKVAEAAPFSDPAVTGAIAPRASIANALPPLSDAARSDSRRSASSGSPASRPADIAPGLASPPEGDASRARGAKAGSRIRWPWSRRNRSAAPVAEASAATDAPVPSGWTATVNPTMTP